MKKTATTTYEFSIDSFVVERYDEEGREVNTDDSAPATFGDLWEGLLFLKDLLKEDLLSLYKATEESREE